MSPTWTPSPPGADMVTPSIMIMGPDTPPATALVTASPDINVESPTDSQVSSSLDKKPTSFPGPRSTIKLEWPPASRNEDVSGSNTQNTTYLGVPPHDHSYASSPISTSSTQGREGSYRPSSTYSALRPILSSTSGSPGPTSPAAPKGFGSPSQIFVARADAQTLYALSDTRTVLSSLVSHKANSTALAAVSIFGATVAWSCVFTAARGSLHCFSWASTAFVSAAVAASGLNIVLDSDDLDFDRDMVARRVVRALNALTGLGVFIGIVLMSLALMTTEPIDDSSRSQSEAWAIWSAGLFTIIATSVLSTAILFIRFKPYKQRDEKA